MPRRIRPTMGDALMVDATIRELDVTPVTWAGIARCECSQKIYTAISSSEQTCLALLRRKHVRHLADCARQRALQALDN